MAALEFKTAQAEFREYYNSQLDLLRGTEKAFRELIKKLLSGGSDFDPPTVTSRVKECAECIRKFDLKYRPDCESKSKTYEIRTYITDLVGIRVTCYYDTDVHKVEKVLTSNFEVVRSTDKTAQMESEADTFGYKGLHLDIWLNPQRQALPEFAWLRDSPIKAVEVQVRTIVQHAWSELDHKIAYKRNIPKHLRRRIRTLAALFELADREFEAVKGEANHLTEQAQKLELSGKQATEEAKVPIDAFHALAILHKNFKREQFIASVVDNFVTEILKRAPGFTTGQFEEAFKNHLQTVKEYAAHRQECDHRCPNPFTQTRYVLYLTNRQIFEQILYKSQRQVFDGWFENSKGTKSNRSTEGLPKHEHRNGARTRHLQAGKQNS
ncbi:MAG: hypothetical protein WB696_24280 [Chthoniobacterales bacterium]|jgi:putative GTP pyrophosphokinase